MPNVLTAGSSLKCPHGGKFVLVASQNQLTVDGQPVLVDGDLQNSSIAGCVPPPNTPPWTPCTKVAVVYQGQATTMSVGGKSVLLETASGGTNGTTPPVPPPWSVVSSGQTKLQAD